MREGIKSVMVEGGAGLISSLISSAPQLVNEVAITISPLFIGGLQVMRGLATVKRLQRPFYSQVGSDIVLLAALPNTDDDSEQNPSDITDLRLN